MSIYHEQLEVAEGASFEEIKEAYFSLAEKVLKGEKDEETFDYFYHIHKAFIFLMAKATGTFYDKKQDSFVELKISELGDWENRFEDREDQLLENSRELWALEWNSFQRSGFYLNFSTLEPADTSVNYQPALFLNLVNPVLLSVLLGWPGLVLSLSVVYATLPHWKKVFRKMFFAPIPETTRGIAYLLNQKVFWLLIFFVTNLLLFLFSTARTFIPFIPLSGLFLGAMILGFLTPVSKISILKPFGRVIPGLGLSPFLLNAFFSINLTLSSPLIEERHAILRNYQMVEGEEEITTYITLEYGVYDNYLHIRHFPTTDELEDMGFIELNIHRGLFGIPVLKSWTLE